MIKKDNTKKQKIIQAAAKIFLEQGLEKARIEDIAKKADIGKGTIYLYFKSKEEIMLEGVKYFADMRISQLKKVLAKYSTNQRKLLKMLEFNRILAKKEPDIFYMNYATLLSTQNTLKKQSVKVFFDQYINLIISIIRNGIYKGEFKICDPEATALAFVLAFDMSILIKGKSSIQPEDLLGLITI